MTMRANPASNAASQALYVLRQAIKTEEVDRNLLSTGEALLAGTLAYQDALYQLAEPELRRLEADFDARMSGLSLAAEANGLDAEARAVEYLWTLYQNPYAEGAFEAFAAQAREKFEAAGQPEFAQAMAEIASTYRHIQEVEDIAAGKLSWAVEKAQQRVDAPDTVPRETTTEWRWDTNQRLADTLGINPHHEPKYRELVGVMEAKRANGELIPGKQYRTDWQSGRPVADRHTGWIEILYKAPKAVSVAYALAKTPEERGLILDAQREAVHASLVNVAKRIGVHRTPDGETPGHITWALFHHATARATPGQPPDPHLHTHAMIPNVVLREDGGVGALHGRGMWSHRQEIDLVYKLELTSGLQRRGIAAEHVPETHDIRLAHISDAMVQHFSKRHEQGVEAARTFMAKRGQDYEVLPPAARTRVLTKAIEATRRSEYGYQGVVPRKIELHWQGQAAAQGWQLRPGVRREQVERSRGWNLTDVHGWGIASGGPFPTPPTGIRY